MIYSSKFQSKATQISPKKAPQINTQKLLRLVHERPSD